MESGFGFARSVHRGAKKGLSCLSRLMKELFVWLKIKKGFTLEIKRESSSGRRSFFLVWRKEVKFFLFRERECRRVQEELKRMDRRSFGGF